MKKFAVRTLPYLMAAALALYLVPWVLDLAHYKDAQSYLYDQALKMANSDNEEEAAQAPDAFSAALKAYASDKPKSWYERYLLPQPDEEVSGLALFHIGNLMRMQNKNKEALAAYVASLRVNAGQRMLLGVSARDDGMHQYGRDFCTSLSDKVAQVQPVTGDECQLLRLQKEANDTRNNLLSLLSEHPELAPLLAQPGDLKAPGGKGPGKATDGQQKDQMPGDAPSKQQGNGNNDAI